MNRMLLVLNGANYSKAAVRKAVWLAKNYSDIKLDMLYINPSCYELYPNLPGYCFWLPDKEFQKIAEDLRNRVMKELVPIFVEMEVVPNIIVRNGDIDREIGELGKYGNYDSIFIASPSRYCGKGNKWQKKWLQEISASLICLV